MKRTRKSPTTNLQVVDFVQQVNWLISQLQELESENQRLKLACALYAFKRPRGRPRKPPKLEAPRKRPGRKSQRLLPSILEFIESLKKEHGVRTDKDALQKWAESLAIKRGEGNHRANAPDVQATLKTFRNQISSLRKSQKFSGK